MRRVILPVKVSVSVVPAKLSTTPNVRIDSPKDISGCIGTITVDGFGVLKEELAEYVATYGNAEFYTLMRRAILFLTVAHGKIALVFMEEKAGRRTAVQRSLRVT